MESHMYKRTSTVVALAASLAACGLIPERNTALDQARGRYTSAQSDDQVASLAPDELSRAADSLRTAESARLDGEPRATVDHLAYMTLQRVTIAQETASSKAARMMVAGAAAQRDQMRLERRTIDADAARQQLALSQQQNRDNTSELASTSQRLQSQDARVSELESQLKDMNVRQTDRGMVVTLGDILFDSGESRIRPGDAGHMSQLAAFFKRHPQRTATIEGYTDNIGSPASNVDLSRRRAQAVATALVNLGVTADRLSTKFHGEEDPAANNATPSGRQMNRRVEVVFPNSSGDISTN